MALVVDDDATVTRRLTRWLDRVGIDVRGAASAAECFEELERVIPDLAFVEERLPDSLGAELIRRIKVKHPHLPTLAMVTGDEMAVPCMEAGAYDYLLKPFDEPKLFAVTRNALTFQRMATQVVSLEREVRGKGYGALIGLSAAMKTLYRQLDRITASDITVLIHGASGTGKELVARAIHDHGSRSRGPFVPVSCAAIPETLQESEIFGHEKGAFTGATARRIGKFEQADGGTLFFDEIGELSPAFQAKLLRVLQERTFQRVGGNKDIQTDVRVVAATNRDLAKEVRQGSFRDDLYYRIAVMELVLPLLREREGDVALLAHTFLEEFDRDAGHAEGRSFSFDALHAMVSYSWPGNVRELQNVVQRAAVLAETVEIALSHLTEGVQAAREPTDEVPASHIELLPSPPPSAVTIPAGLSLAELERTAVEQAYYRAPNNISEVARELGISRAALYRKLRQYGLYTP